VSLARLIAEAEVLAGGKHQCAVLGHLWKSAGGRACPRLGADEFGRFSQTVYVCESCGAEDYGDPGGPAYAECFTHGPCDRSCLPEPQPAEPK
jgi:hypothetical protein